MKEIWKDIYYIDSISGELIDYHGYYQVSNLGRVKTLSRKIYFGYNNEILKITKEKILKLKIKPNGYLCVGLHKDKKQKYFSVHRLVAHMFVDGYFDGAEVDHINTIKTDNRADNLLWVTSKENSNNLLTKENYSKAKKGKNHPMSKKIIQYDKQGNLIKIWDYIKQASNELGIDNSDITKCCKGKIKTAGGFIWKYVD